MFFFFIFTSENLEAAKKENEVCQEDHDRLLKRHNKTLQELQQKDEQYRKRLGNGFAFLTLPLLEQLCSGKYAYNSDCLVIWKLERQ